MFGIDWVNLLIFAGLFLLVVWAGVSILRK